MNRVKATSSLLLFASILVATAPLHAKQTRDYGTELLPHMFGSNSASTLNHAHKLPLREQWELRDALLEQYGTAVNKLLPFHSVNPEDSMLFLTHVGKDIKNSELARGILSSVLFGLGAVSTGLFGLASMPQPRRGSTGSWEEADGKSSSPRTTSGGVGSASRNWFTATAVLSVLSGINLVGILSRQGILNGLRKLPAMDVASKSFFELRGLRQGIATELAKALKSPLINNRLFIDRATLALSIEKAYNKKQLQIAAIGGAVVLATALLYLAVSTIRRNTKAKVATIGAGALGGLAALLSLSPFATPVIDERLKRLQAQYQQSLTQVQQGN